MKFALKSLVIASAVVAAGVANAAVVTATVGNPLAVTDPNGSGRVAELTLLGSSAGTLEFSNGTGVFGGTPTTSVGGLVGALNVGKVVITAEDNAAITETKVTIGRATPRGIVKIGAGVTGLQADNVTGQILSVNSFGGATQTAAYLEGVLDGGKVTVKNLRFDLANNAVYADMSGAALNPDDTYGATVTAPGIKLWTIGSVTGPTSIPPAALLAAADGNFAPMIAAGYTQVGEPVNGLYTVNAQNLLGNLKVTTEGFEFFAKTLGLTPGSTGYTTLAGVNNGVDGWGSVKSSITFTARELGTTPAIPEPSTYAMMAVGLVGLGLVARRRKAA